MFFFLVWFLIMICFNSSFLNGVIFFIGLKVFFSGKGVLYMSFLFLGSGVIFGVVLVFEYMFFIYVFFVGDYYKVSMCVFFFWMYNFVKKIIFKIEMVVFVFSWV